MAGQGNSAWVVTARHPGEGLDKGVGEGAQPWGVGLLGPHLCQVGLSSAPGTTTPRLAALGCGCRMGLLQATEGQSSKQGTHAVGSGQ